MLLSFPVSLSFKLTCTVWAALLASGCATMLPTAKENMKSSWETFEDAKNAFEAIVPHRTRVEELHKMGYDPFNTPNIRILTHLEIISSIMPNQSFTKEDLDEELADCLKVKKGCKAYSLAVRRIHSQRHGNFVLDILRFQRKTRKTGWEFKGFLALKHDVVVYKIWSGRPNVEENQANFNPLGFLQEPESILSDLSNATTGLLF